MDSRPKITAIVVTCNEAKKLEGCLRALRWCDQLIVVDLASRDGSREIALRYADLVLDHPPSRVVEPVRLFAARHASHDWLLLMDPDEQMPEQLAEQIRDALAAHPDAGGFRLPLWFYFKGKRLDGTYWGGGHRTFLRLIHRERCTLCVDVHRGIHLLHGYDERVIEPRQDNYVRHYWSQSYVDLLYQHMVRYAYLDAKSRYERGERFRLRRGIVHPLAELKRSLKDFDGWRMGPRGWLLSGIYFLYTLGVAWMLLVAAFTRRPANAQSYVSPTESRKAA